MASNTNPDNKKKKPVVWAPRAVLVNVERRAASALMDREKDIKRINVTIGDACVKSAKLNAYPDAKRTRHKAVLITTAFVAQAIQNADNIRPACTMLTRSKLSFSWTRSFNRTKKDAAGATYIQRPPLLANTSYKASFGAGRGNDLD
jgi:hypothetical protein